MTHQQLQTIDADTLLSTTLPPTRFIIDRLLPQGLHILAGAPKVGKSWLALWLCLQVAQGTSVWDFPTHRGTVLYLCLEDSLTRIQSRLFQITDDAPEALHFATIAAGIGEGLEEQLTNFLTQHPDTSLVVIDTLQRIRTGSDSGNPYANDYRDISVLKALADKHHIAILLIHHLRKMNDDDPMNMISGTTGISGATDSNFVLKERRRGSGEATLYCTGRDIEYAARSPRPLAGGFLFALGYALRFLPTRAAPSREVMHMTVSHSATPASPVAGLLASSPGFAGCSG